ncbi:MFS general substrate transporter [Clavulina sp. PMI_390]|nr:MFS general substrate transporter [Clavulina sp. PMI_390]
MLVELHIADDPEQVGFYSGVIESVFSATSFITILPLSLAANRYGRKPVILIGMAGLGISLVFFGTSRSFLTLVISRCIGGGMGGTWAAVRVMLGELTDKSTQDQAFVGLMVTYRMGQIVGLPLGGILAHPERHWPVIFDSTFWRRYPFALPCFVGAGFALFAVGCGIFLLPETLRRPQKTAKTLNASATSTDPAYVGQQRAQHDPSPKAMWPSFLTKDVVAALIANMLNGFSAEVLFAVYSVFAFTPVDSGGLGFSESQIGISLGVRAALQIVIMFLYQPLLDHPWVGAGSAVRIYKISTFIWPISCIGYPLLNIIARAGMDVDGWIFSVWMGAFFALWCLAWLSWANNAPPSAESLAAFNGLLQMTIAIPQAVAPAFATSLFAYCIQHQLLGGYLQWIIFALLTSIGAFQSLMLREVTHDWREDANSAQEDDQAVPPTGTLPDIPTTLA